MQQTQTTQSISETLLGQAHLAGSVVKAGSGIFRERMVRPRPRVLTDVPAATADMAPAWLTAVLCSGVPGAQVVSAVVGGGSDGSSNRRAIGVTYNDAGTQAGLPTALFNKSLERFHQRLLLGVTGNIIQEPLFYNRIQRELSIESPDCLYAAYDPATWRCSVLMTDLTVTKGATFNRPGTPFSRRQMEDFLTILATYHGKFWNNPRLDAEFTWLRTPATWLQCLVDGIAFKKRTAIGMRRARKSVPASHFGHESEIWQALEKAIWINSRRPFTLVHGDTHLGNSYTTAAGKIGLCDWQCTMKGGWAFDYSYAVGTVLTIEDRRAWERDLLAFYLDRLAAFGGIAPSFEQAWQAYRQMMLYPYVGWTYNMGHGPLQPHFQPDDVCYELISRLGTAVTDLASLRSVDEAML